MDYLPKGKDTQVQPSFDHWQLYKLLSMSHTIEFGTRAKS